MFLITFQICWAVTPVILIAIFGIAIYFWDPPTYGGVIHYPGWAHGIGWFLTLVVALQIPIGAIIALIYFTAKGRPMDAFRPAPNWGPGDKEGRKEWIAYKQTKALTCKRHPFMAHHFHPHQQPEQPAGYDNVGMYYPDTYHNGNASYHM